MAEQQTVEAPQLKKRKVEDEKSDLAPVSNLLIKRHSEKATIPTKGSPLAAGYDLYRCTNDRVILCTKYLIAISTVLKTKLYLLMARLS